MSENEKSSERRRFTRIPFEASVTISNPSGNWTAKLKDLSLNGVLISVPQNWLTNDKTECLLEINPAENAFYIQMEATISHQEGNTIGFRCDHIDIDSISHLRRLIELNIGDDEVLNRQLSALVSNAA